jgi:hypothetical protein
VAFVVTPAQGKHPERRRVSRLDAWLPVALVLVLLIPALQPLWQPGVQQTDDGAHHIFRLFGLDDALRAGYSGTRWIADEGFGYGFPVLNFYAPLSYYAGLAFHRLGAGLASSFEWTLAAGLILSALAMYLFAARLLGRWGGAVAAVAYAWAPYHLADAWTRGAVGEHLAFIWIPLLLLALWQIAEARGRALWRPVLWGGAALAGLVLTHNVTAVVAAPLLGAWALFMLWLVPAGGRLRCLLGFIVLAVIGFGLSAAFWLPAFAELRYVRAGNVEESFGEWALALPPLAALIESGWAHRYTLAQGVRWLHPLPVVQAIVTVIGLAAGAWRWRSLSRAARGALVIFAGIAAFALLMQSDVSRPIWQNVPGLRTLQIAWRWQTLTTFATAMIAGYVASEPVLDALTAALKRVPRAAIRAALVIVVAALLMSTALPLMPWEAAHVPTADYPLDDARVNRSSMALYDYGRGLWLREHGNAFMFEYMPVWNEVPREEFFLSTNPASSEANLDAVVIPERQTPLEHWYRVSAAAPWTLQLHQFYFPGWEAVIDGQVQPAAPTGSLGLAGVQIPAGEHNVNFRFGATAPRRIGWALTLITAAAWLLAAVWLRRWRWLAAIALVVIYAGATALSARANPAAYTPVAVDANFDNQVRLAGFHAPVDALGPGKANDVTLEWLALTQPATDYKVFVHLIDTTGKLWAQHDGQPGFYFTPATRWQPGEIITDHHILEWQGDPPPGRYQLRAGLYDPATGSRLPVTLADGATADQVLLAEFDLP